MGDFVLETSTILMAENVFMELRRQEWIEARNYWENEGHIYTQADDYFEKHFGKPTFNKDHFLSLSAKYGNQLFTVQK